MPLQPKKLAENKKFIAREFEREQLSHISSMGESAILAVHGRRRVGKTELLEQSLRNRNILKFEGLENKTQQQQRKQVLHELSKYLQDPIIAKLNLTRWVEVFELIARYVSKGMWTVYFEEVQWLADYKEDFASDLKYVWDNELRYNPELLLVLCGSSPSFMIKNIVQSKALYNRSMYEMPLAEFTLLEARALLPKLSPSELMDAYLIVGGIPEYLKKLRRASSVFLSICEQAFVPGGFLLTEYRKIFISSLANNAHYKSIIEFLSKNKYATRLEISKHLKIKSGGTLTELLDELELCGFIEKYTPYNATPNSSLVRFCIRDSYLNFYFKFIKPVQGQIENGDYKHKPNSAIKHESYRRWLGYAFERFCRHNHRIIATILRFSAVRYRSGTYFSRSTATEHPGFQADLLFDRDDHVLTIVEIKYKQSPIGTEVIKEFEQKLSLLPNHKNKTLHKVLIASNGATEALIKTGYFDNLIDLKDIFTPNNWE